MAPFACAARIDIVPVPWVRVHFNRLNLQRPCCRLPDLYTLIMEEGQETMGQRQWGSDNEAVTRDD
jgi:hypothetical protein